MGYTEEIYRVKKENVNNVRSLTPKELFELFKENVKPGDSDLVDDLEKDNSYQIWFPSLLNALDGIRVFDFGKDYENADDMHKNGEPLFTNEETTEEYSDYCPYLITKNALVNAIEFYRQKITNYYKSLLMSEEDYKKYQEEHFLSLETNAKRRERDVKQKITEWSNEKFPPYNLDGENMINSWLYEYDIFELVFIYKTTNWDKECLIFFGH